MVIDLAINAKTDPVRLSEISKRQSISLKYLEKLIRELKKAGYVKSMRGPYGGYMLAKPLAEISVGDIVRVLEGSDSITDCTENDDVCGSCTRAGDCLTQYIWAETGKAMFEKLDSFKIVAMNRFEFGKFSDEFNLFIPVIDIYGFFLTHLV